MGMCKGEIYTSLGWDGEDGENEEDGGRQNKGRVWIGGLWRGGGVAGTIKRGCWGAWAMGGVCVAAINQEKEWNASLEITLLHIFSSCEVPGVHVLEILICT